MTDNASKRIIVLDTSAFIAGFDPFSIDEEQYTVPKVEKEIPGRTMTWVRFKTAVESGKLKILAPRKIFKDLVEQSAIRVGNSFVLSEADLEVLALAAQLRAEDCSPLIATDDYSIQNVANELDMNFVSLATFGIRFHMKWMRYCPACRRRYPVEYISNKCESCGTRLARKALSKKTVKRNDHQKK